MTRAIQLIPQTGVNYGLRLFVDVFANGWSFTWGEVALYVVDGQRTRGVARLQFGRVVPGWVRGRAWLVR